MNERFDFENQVKELEKKILRNGEMTMAAEYHIAFKHLEKIAKDRLDEITGNKPVPMPDESLLDTRCDDLPLEVRTRIHLKMNNVDTLRQLLVYTNREVICMRNFSKKSLVDIQRFLESKCMWLGMLRKN